MIQRTYTEKHAESEEGDKSGSIDMFLWFYLLNFISMPESCSEMKAKIKQRGAGGDTTQWD